ncbi:MAG: hypothetical protein CEO22_584 [Candidatus Berkelbacteria bacterium Gr01-1014_85]|uniref:Uncharacterized protein n=1 Tax=Candidatus Berkelbacteria bacterium Gr01-1014_85 TaxID=2017150 RepID=A0A554JA18_9BACT|nr:MAG: hypothetical protein CEO22_584 [Candidatus Berkelbacteria bacterium Gr01-1014_85]
MSLPEEYEDRLSRMDEFINELCAQLQHAYQDTQVSELRSRLAKNNAEAVANYNLQQAKAERFRTQPGCEALYELRVNAAKKSLERQLAFSETMLESFQQSLKKS